MTKMPHLPEMKYDYADQLNEVTLNLDGNKAYYVYDANGERVRKVVVKNNKNTDTFGGWLCLRRSIKHIKVQGREHNSLANLTDNDFVNNIIRPEDGENMRNFTQEYQYDEIGNLLQMKSNGVWTRDYRYDFATNNYLLDHDLQGTTNIYEYVSLPGMLRQPWL